MSEIDYDYVSKLQEHLLNLWTPAHEQWRMWHDYHDQRHLIKYAKPADVRKLGIIRGKLQAMVDTLVTDKPDVTRAPVAEGQEHEAKADKVEKWGKALLLHSMTSGTTLPPFRSAATFLGLLGYAVGAVRWDDKLWDAKAKNKVAHGPGYRKRLGEFERAQSKVFPYVIEYPHPARILLPHQEKRPSVGIEIASMYAWQVEEMLEAQGLDSTDVHGDRYKPLEVLNYWDEKKRGLFIDKVEVEVRDNGLGVVPFVHGYSGYGHEHMPTMGGISDMGPMPEDWAVGRFAGILGSIQALDELTTALTYLVERAAYMNYFTNEDSEEMTRKLEEAGLGGVVHVDGDPTHALTPSQIPQLGAWVFEQMASLRRDVDEGTFQGVVAGQMSANVPTATGTAIQLGQARLGFGQPMMQLNLMAGEILGLCARMTTLRAETVTIDGVSCGADDFEGNFDFKVDFLAKDEGQRLRDTAAANEGYKIGTESFDGVQEAKGIADVTGKWKEVLVGKARTSPQYQATVLEQAIGIVKQRMADEAAKSGTPVPSGEPPLGPDGQPLPPTPQPSQGLIQMPGGPQQAAQVQQGMLQTPGAGIVRVVPSG